MANIPSLSGICETQLLPLAMKQWRLT